MHSCYVAHICKLALTLPASTSTFPTFIFPTREEAECLITMDSESVRTSAVTLGKEWKDIHAVQPCRLEQVERFLKRIRKHEHCLEQMSFSLLKDNVLKWMCDHAEMYVKNPLIWKIILEALESTDNVSSVPKAMAKKVLEAIPGASVGDAETKGNVSAVLKSMFLERRIYFRPDFSTFIKIAADTIGALDSDCDGAFDTNSFRLLDTVFAILNNLIHEQANTKKSFSLFVEHMIDPIMKIYARPSYSLRDGESALLPDLLKSVESALLNGLFSRSHFVCYPSSFSAVREFVATFDKAKSIVEIDKGHNKKLTKKRKREARTPVKTYVNALVEKVRTEGTLWKISILYTVFMGVHESAKKSHYATSISGKANEISVGFHFFVELYSAAYYSQFENAGPKRSMNLFVDSAANRYELLLAMHEIGDGYLYNEQNLQRPQFKILGLFFDQTLQHIKWGIDSLTKLTSSNVKDLINLFSIFLKINHELLNDSLVDVLVCAQKFCDHFGMAVFPVCVDFAISIMKVYSSLRDIAVILRAFFKVSDLCSSTSDSVKVFLFEAKPFRFALGKAFAHCLPAQIPGLWQLCRDKMDQCQSSEEGSVSSKLSRLKLVSIFMAELCGAANVANHNAVALSSAATVFCNDLLVKCRHSSISGSKSLYFSILDAVMYMSDRCQRFLPLNTDIDATNVADLSIFKDRQWKKFLSDLIETGRGAEENVNDATCRLAIRVMAKINRELMSTSATGKDFKTLSETLCFLSTIVMNRYSSQPFVSDNARFENECQILFDNIILVSKYASALNLERFSSKWVSFLIEQSDEKKLNTHLVAADFFEARRFQPYVTRCICNELLESCTPQTDQITTETKERVRKMFKLAAAIPVDYWDTVAIEDLCRATSLLFQNPVLLMDLGLAIIGLHVFSTILDASPMSLFTNIRGSHFEHVFCAHLHFSTDLDEKDIIDYKGFQRRFAEKLMQQLIIRYAIDGNEHETVRCFYVDMCNAFVIRLGQDEPDVGNFIEPLVLLLNVSNETLSDHLKSILSINELEEDTGAETDSATRLLTWGKKCALVGHSIFKVDNIVSMKMLSEESCSDDIQVFSRLISCIITYSNISCTAPIEIERIMPSSLKFVPNLVNQIVRADPISDPTSAKLLLLSTTQALPQFKSFSSEVYSLVVATCFRVYKLLVSSDYVSGQQFLSDTMRNLSIAADTQDCFEQLISLVMDQLLESRRLSSLHTAIPATKALGIILDTITETWQWQLVASSLPKLFGELGNFITFCCTNKSRFAYFDHVFTVFKVLACNSNKVVLSSGHVSFVLTLLGSTLHAWMKCRSVEELPRGSHQAGFLSFITSLYSLLMSFLQYRNRSVYACCGQVVTLVNDLMEAIFQYYRPVNSPSLLVDGSDNLEGKIDNDFLSSSRCLRRLYEEIANHKTVFKHFAPYLVDQILKQMKEFGLVLWNHREIKEGLFFVFSMCSEHETRQIFATQDAVGRSFFQKFFDEFKKSKFDGI